MSLVITIQKTGYRMYDLSAKRIHKHDIKKVTHYHVLAGVPTLQIALVEARKLAKSWFGHCGSGPDKESVIDLHVRGGTKKQNGNFLYENGKFYRMP